MFQPPCPGGSFFARRATMVPQSLTASSTLTPEVVGGDIAECRNARDLAGGYQNDFLALVAGLGEQLFGACEILLVISLGARLRAVGAAADKERPALAPPPLIAEGSAGIFSLVDGQRQCLPRLRIVERRIEMVWPDDAVRIDEGNPSDDDAGRVLEDRYLVVRKLVDEQGYASGVKGTTRDRKTGKIDSKPYVYQNNERVMDLSNQILQCLQKKSAKKYPPGTVLIVDCVAGLLDQSEWEDAVQEVKKAELHAAFREVFLCELVMSRSATLYGENK